jgi:hypothetical protein
MSNRQGGPWRSMRASSAPAMCVPTRPTIPTRNIYVTAYKGNGSYVIVAINMGTSGVNQPFTIQNQSIGSLTPYQTSASALSMQQLATVYTANNSTFTGYLPPQSITTFVAQGSTGGTINTSAWYQVVNKTSGMCADDNGNSTTPGTALIQWSCGSGKYNQEWQFRPATTSGHYGVFNRNASSLTWDDYNFGTSNGTNVDLWTYISGQTNQQWQANYLGNGLWQFKNLNSGLCLDNTGSRTRVSRCGNGSASPGTQISSSNSYSSPDVQDLSSLHRKSAAYGRRFLRR